MLRRIDEKTEFIRTKLADYLTKEMPALHAVTGGMGVELGGDKRHFALAKQAAEKRKFQKDKDIYWVPFVWEDRVVLVAGIKNKKGYPAEEVDLISGLLDQISFDLFLGQQIEVSIDQKSNFIKEILETDSIRSMDNAIDRGDILGVNLRSPQAVILIKIPGLFESFKNKFKEKDDKKVIINVTDECQHFLEKLNNAFENYEQNIFACLGTDLFACLKWAEGNVSTANTIKYFRSKAKYIKEIVEDATEMEATIGVGQYYPGINGLRKSYSDAKNALELGEKIWGDGKIYHILDIGMFVSLSPELSFQRKCELAHQILGKLLPDKDLYKTVRVFLENDMNLSVSATKLHLHRNTLIYRLDKIKRLVGLDPRNFSDAVQIKLGILLYGPNIACEN